MQVLIDIGNSRSKYVFVRQGQRSAINYCQTGQIDHNWLTEHFGHVEQIIVANVGAEAINQTLLAWGEAGKKNILILRTSATSFGVKSAYQQPETLGIDRWMVVLAADKLYPKQNCVIVDTGTATTIDVINTQAEHSGGWILPGIELLQSTLVSSTQRINVQPITHSSDNLGTSTSECVHYGAWAATVGAVEQLVQRFNRQETSVNVLITGGNGRQLAGLLSIKNVVIDDLVFIGMQRFVVD